MFFDGKQTRGMDGRQPRTERAKQSYLLIGIRLD